MFKNTATTLVVFAWDYSTGAPYTGGGGTLTAYVKIDAGSLTVLADTTATEIDATTAPGYYLFDLAQAETNGDRLVFTAKSSTSNKVVLAVPAVVFTIPATGILAPTTAGRTLDVSTGGEAGLDWANVGSPTTSLALTGTTIAVTQKVDVDTIKTNPVVNAGTVTFPTTATLASTTNITAGTVTLTTAGIDALFTRQLTESYNADGTAPTVAQALLLLISTVTEFSISGTTITAKKLDGSTTAATFTLDDATNPTSRTRAT